MNKYSTLQKCSAFLLQTIQLSGITCLWKVLENGWNAAGTSVSLICGRLVVCGGVKKLPLCGMAFKRCTIPAT